jgi:inositol transporter-like SP family MFS transporter
MVADRRKAPDASAARIAGVAQVLWYLGPVVVLLMFLVLSPLGLLGARLVFAHLAILAVALTFLRSRMSESVRWLEAQTSAQAGGPAPEKSRLRDLFTRQHIRSMAFLAGMYVFWNLWAGTNGFFFPYILRTVGNQSQVVSVAIQALSFLIGMLSIWLIFMRFSDRVNQRMMFLASAVIQIVGMALLAVFPLTLPVALIHVFLMAFGQGFGAQCFFQLWSGEMFPTMLRSTAQGVMFAVVRVTLGVFSFFVPMLTATGFTTLAWILTGFLVLSGLIGFLGAPRNEGKSLEELDRERVLPA